MGLLNKLFLLAFIVLAAVFLLHYRRMLRTLRVGRHLRERRLKDHLEAAEEGDDWIRRYRERREQERKAASGEDHSVGRDG